jgi:hypothetical protein
VLFALGLAAAGLVGLVGPRASQASDARDGGASLPVAGRVVPTPVSDVERMCTLLTGCPDLPLPTPGDLASCVRDLGGWLARADAVTFSLTLRECALGATSCDQLATCARRGVRPDACQGRGQNGASAFCDVEGRAVTCLHGAIAQVRDCARGGERCRASNGDAQCALATIAGAGGTSNDACAGAGAGAGSAARCSASGTHLLTCDQGKPASIDCAAFGLVCASGADGAGCAPPTAACASGSERCENGVAVRCLHGHEVRIECAAAGLVCDGAGAEVGACRVPAVGGGAVDPCKGAPAPRCGNDIAGSLTYCATSAGGMRRLSCKQAGLGGCVRDARGARCAP